MGNCALRSQLKRTWRSNRGFTLIEVLVGLALMGICVALFLNLITDHLLLTRKLIERNEKMLHVINKTEEACLGVLRGDFEGVENRKIWRGKTNEGLVWKVVEQVSKEDPRALLYDVAIGDISLQGVRIQGSDEGDVSER